MGVACHEYRRRWVHSRFEIYCETRPLDYVEHDVCRSITQGFFSEHVPVPPHVLTLADGPRSGFSFLIDTNRGTIVVWEGD